jgi:hypothetical protein
MLMQDLILVGCDTKEMAEEVRQYLLGKKLEGVHVRVFSLEEFFVERACPEPMFLELIKENVDDFLEMSQSQIFIPIRPDKKFQRERQRAQQAETKRKMRAFRVR